MEKQYIPSSFQLGGLTITVTRPPFPDEAQHECHGIAKYEQSEIAISSLLTNEFKQYGDYVFFHELVHYLFYMAEEPKLRHNEKLVSLLATFLYQYMQTAEFREKEDPSCIKQ